MLTNFGCGLVVLMIPLVIELLIWQSRLKLPDFDHKVVEILILAGIYWLISRIVYNDELHSIREGFDQKRRASVKSHSPLTR